MMTDKTITELQDEIDDHIDCVTNLADKAAWADLLRQKNDTLRTAITAIEKERDDIKWVLEEVWTRGYFWYGNPATRQCVFCNVRHDGMDTKHEPNCPAVQARALVSVASGQVDEADATREAIREVEAFLEETTHD